MPTLQEILAAKKKASAAAASAPTSAPTENISPVATEKAVEEKTIASPLQDMEASKPVIPATKKSFAEMMAEKKAMAAAPVPTAAPVPEKKEEKVEEKEISPLANTLAAAAKANPVVPESATDAEKAYYQDIKPRIDNLISLSDDDLKGAMKTLKEAIMQNPSAASLLLDNEIGEMVKAIRRMTGEALVEAKKDKKEKKSKAIDLSDPVVMQSVLDEL
jgi:hypothetical protein